MRICPKCGYTDPPEWRHSKYSYWIDFCTWEDFKRLHPGLSEKLKCPGEKIEDENFVYRRNQNGRYVERKAKIDYNDQFNLPMEKARHDKRSHWSRNTKHTQLTQYLHPTKNTPSIYNRKMKNVWLDSVNRILRHHRCLVWFNLCVRASVTVVCPLISMFTLSCCLSNCL